MARICLLAGIALALLAAPVQAASAPTILAAGIDGADRVYATWQLAPGTRLSHVTFATSPAPDPMFGSFFADGSYADFECAPPPPAPACRLTATAASYTGVAVPRDRRYFVKVGATDDDGFGTSLVWIIDESKPLVPGDVDPVTGPATNNPVSGRPFSEDPSPAPPAPLTRPPAPAPAPEISIDPPSTIGAILARGVRLRVICPGVPCAAAASLELGGLTLARSTLTVVAGGTRALVLRPTGTSRRRLSRRASARLRVVLNVTPDGGTTTRVSSTFTARR